MSPAHPCSGSWLCPSEPCPLHSGLFFGNRLCGGVVASPGTPTTSVARPVTRAFHMRVLNQPLHRPVSKHSWPVPRGPKPRMASSRQTERQDCWSPCWVITFPQEAMSIGTDKPAPGSRPHARPAIAPGLRPPPFPFGHTWGQS